MANAVIHTIMKAPKKSFSMLFRRKPGIKKQKKNCEKRSPVQIGNSTLVHRQSRTWLIFKQTNTISNNNPQEPRKPLTTTTTLPSAASVDIRVAAKSVAAKYKRHGIIKSGMKSMYIGHFRWLLSSNLRL